MSPDPDHSRGSWSPGAPVGPRRETLDVSFPPPPPPPPAGAGGGPVRGGNDPIDWDRFQDLARRWYAPLLERDTWMAVLYLVVGIFSAIGFFIALNVVGWATFGLLFAGVGVFLVRPFFAMVEALARAERTMPRWIGVEIEPRPIAPMTGLGFRAALDPERWRQVGFLALNVLLGTVIGNLGVAAFGVAPQVAFTDPISGGWFGLGPIAWVIGFAFAVVLFGAAPRIAVFVARFKAQVTAWFLGVDRLAEAEQRVSALSTQRQDILDAVASERRRIERNLHDGVQQQLVAIGLDLGMAEQQLGHDPDRARELIVSAREKVQGSIGELRQLGRGLHPAILADRGIDAALSAVVAGAPMPVSVHVDPELDLSTDVAETVYFVANEAIANVLKHARARVASVHVSKVAANVRVTVHDDGQGGVDASRGTGIAGIRARVNAVDGSFTITSPTGGPTTLVVEIPRHIPDRPRPTP
jgi:signal transduction histidine kinase